jgi:LPS O-antigen subunit length determinant protein (WzzB/FepE family)
MISKEKNQSKNEIDLIEIGITIFNNKWKILLTTIVAMVMVIIFIYQTKQPEKYTATTEIRPSLNHDPSEYFMYNSFTQDANLHKIETYDGSLDKYSKEFLDEIKQKIINNRFEIINADYLLSLFVIKFKDFNFIRDQLIKFNYLEKKDYVDEKAYESALTKLIYSIKIFDVNEKKTDDSNNNKKDEYSYVSITTDNFRKWKDFLSFVEAPINKEIQLFLKKSINQKIESSKKKDEYKLIDINNEIMNEKRNWEIKIENKLVFLAEQAIIARTLNIPKSNLNPPTIFNMDTGLITNSTTEIPYYMRGFEMIEKEMELIKERINQETFSEELNNLGEKKRSLISTQGKIMERLQKEFINTPIHNLEKFSAGKLAIDLTRVESDRLNLIKIIFITGVISLIFAIFCVLIANEVLKRR